MSIHYAIEINSEKKKNRTQTLITDVQFQRALYRKIDLNHSQYQYDNILRQHWKRSSLNKISNQFAIAKIHLYELLLLVEELRQVALLVLFWCTCACAYAYIYIFMNVWMCAVFFFYLYIHSVRCTIGVLNLYGILNDNIFTDTSTSTIW